MATEYAHRAKLSRPFPTMLGRLLIVLLACEAAFASGSSTRRHVMTDLLAIEQLHPDLCKSALDTASSRSRILAMAAEVRTRLETMPPSAESAVQALNGIVFGPGGIRSSQDLHDPCNLLLSGVLARGQGYCVGVAAVYLAVADELDLPVYAVATPSHVFLRYDDGTMRINIETFNGGAAVLEDEYIRQNRIAATSVRKGVFLEDLTTERFLAQIHNNLGVIYSERREFERAAAEYDLALRLDRLLPAAWYNSGKDLQQQGQLKEAVRAFSKALQLHPNDTWALNNRAMAYRDLKRPDRARVDLDLALRIDPGFEQARQNLAAIGAKTDSP